MKKIIDNPTLQDSAFGKLLNSDDFQIPSAGDLIKGTVLSASKAEVKLDIGGVMTGVVRGPELYEEDDDYAKIKPGQEVEATVIEGENENGELELSFRFAGQERAWEGLRSAYQESDNIKVKVADVNKGGLLVKYRQIAGFLPVSQLAPENYPRVSGGDKGKILEKLRSFVGAEFEVKVSTLNEREDKIIFSEKDAWNEKQKDVISKYKIGTEVEGTIAAITNFGVFVNFADNLEGLIHISELAWQRIDDPADLFRVGDKIKAEVIGVENSKIFLSAKKLQKDPWELIGEKYKLGQTVQGKIIKVNPFGLFVSLDDDIHGLAHISQLKLLPKEKINDKFKVNEKVNFEIVSMKPEDHRLGLAFSGDGAQEEKSGEDVSQDKEDKKEEKSVKVKEKKKEEKSEKPEKKEKKKEEKSGKPEKKESKKEKK
ncbi:MAG: S1 RNA-binding domain-containing protein [bacterium]